MQGNKILLAVVSGLAAISITVPALAQTMSAPSGWYLELNGGSSHISNTDYPGSSSSSGIGGNGNVGYKFMPYFAAEIGYTKYANSSIKAGDGTKAANVTHYSYDIAARGILPISDSGVEAFGKLGAQHISSHISLVNNAAANSIGLGGSSHTSTGLYIGLGGQMYFSPEFAGVVQWQRAQGSSGTGTEDLYSIGISFIFV